MPGCLPLGVFDTGKFPAELDEDAMWQWCLKRSGAASVESAQARDCSRPAPVLAKPTEDHLGVSNLEGAKLDDLTRTGWAVLYGANTSQAIKDQLAPLIALRKSQVKNRDLFKEFDGAEGGYTPGQSVDQWLQQFRVSSSNQVRPSAGVPFYIMIVAAPDDISFEFQYQLDIYWGVGRLWLDNDQDYGAYAAAVIRNEAPGAAVASRRLSFFNPRFAHDNGATAMLCDGLVTKLCDLKIGDDYGFSVDVVTNADASKAKLIEMYSGKTQRPGIYFCGSHGLLRTPFDNEHLPDTMGAILCAEWDGASAPGKADYMAGRDLLADADLTGTVHFLFACYSGGWPGYSTYDGQQLASGPMVARLPQTILAKGGLAVLGHIDRAWSYSYESGGGIDRTQEFESILTRLMDGARAGHATDAFNIRWNVVAGYIAEQQRSELIATTQQLHNLWVEHDDARGYVLYGDPAVRLNLEAMG